MNSRQDLNPESIVETLREHGIRPSAQRVAVASYVLQTDEHPSAEGVLAAVSPDFPVISRATVYNTLHLFVEHGLLREVKVGASSAVYDANTDRHHHFIDDETGEIHDIPWEAVGVTGVDELEGYQVREYHVVLKGRKKKPSR